MGRIIAIDYGLKRTGLAVTDGLQIIATALETVETRGLIDYLKKYFAKEQVDEIIVGMPRQMSGADSEIVPHIKQFATRLKAVFPDLKVSYVDERFTSKMAQRAMIEGGMKRKDRRVRGNVDKISATLILQSYLESRI